ncbi:hypothetical protein HDU91_004605, partial [Kappamyces sp. JEL0680]
MAPKKREAEFKEPSFTLDLAPLKRVSVSEFQGKPRLDLRNFYKDKDTDVLKPTQKGISLSVEEWKVLLDHVPDIQAALDAAEPAEPVAPKK